MIKISYITHDDVLYDVEVEPGCSVMEAAVSHDVPGIEAECGGACACATCHVYVNSDWYDRLPAVEEMERAMLDFVSAIETTSRLSCQIKVTAELDKLVVRIPESQY